MAQKVYSINDLLTPVASILRSLILLSVPFYSVHVNGDDTMSDDDLPGNDIVSINLSQYCFVDDKCSVVFQICNGN